MRVSDALSSSEVVWSKTYWTYMKTIILKSSDNIILNDQRWWKDLRSIPQEWQKFLSFFKKAAQICFYSTNYANTKIFFAPRVRPLTILGVNRCSFLVEGWHDTSRLGKGFHTPPYFLINNRSFRTEWGIFSFLFWAYFNPWFAYI